MAKVSVVQRNLRRQRLVKKYAAKRAILKVKVCDAKLPIEERFTAQLELSALPRDSSITRVRNRCALTGRGRGYYRKFGISRICLRTLASCGELPGVTKASW